MINDELSKRMAMHSAVKDFLETHPILHYVFFELTRQCNLKCRHCGSSCNRKLMQQIESNVVFRVIDEITDKVTPQQTMFCITGGEPLLYDEWAAIGSYISSKGYHWGMTTNGTLITPEIVEKMVEAGMKTISVSLDGLEEVHEWLREKKGCYKAAVKGIKMLVESKKFRCVQVTTVVHPKNISDLESMHEFFKNLKVDSWKLTGVEPIGEAINNPELFLSGKQYRQLLDFICEKRTSKELEVTFGCSHFLTEKYDNAVRKQRFICGAGTMIASISADGDILGCLDIDNRAATKQGNVYEENFWDVWENKFEIFRGKRENKREKCNICDYSEFCRGDSWHTWDFGNSVPKICMMDYLEEKYDGKCK